MSRGKRKKILHIKSTIFIVAIIAVSSIGIGYGYWNEGLNMDVSISTGNFNLSFTGGQSDNLIVVPSFDGKTLKVSGECYEGKKETITFSIINEGTVPAVLEDGTIIYPGKTREFKYIIDLEEYRKPLLQGKSIVPEQYEEGFDMDQIIEELFPTETYTFTEYYYFKQGL
ncbi:MAG: hypothetical protein GXY88_07500 [Tissierellia bacterium]|nr:hypothetical protein [Tissierellia bacterium]